MSDEERAAWALVRDLAELLREAVDYTNHRPRCTHWSYPPTCSCGFREWMQQADAKSADIEERATKA